jgi:protein gp37
VGDDSAIEWTDATWNPTTGCDQVSPGCDHCYALTLAKRLKAMDSPAYQQDGDPRTSGPGFALQVHPDRLDQPLRWTRPRTIFVNSMSDLFHPRVPDEFIARVFAVMAAAPQHTFQVLTKRPKRMRALLGNDGQTLLEATCDDETAMALYAHGWPLSNVWLGTSVEDQQRADERIPALLDTPATVRFLSCEPLLGPVDLTGWLAPNPDGARLAAECAVAIECRHGHDVCPTCDGDPASTIDWAIVGGESGPGARPMHPQWVRDLRDQCTAAGVAFFFKQWGAWAPDTNFELNGAHTIVSEHGGDRPFTRGWGVTRVGKRAAGRLLEGRTWDELPEGVTAHA